MQGIMPPVLRASFALLILDFFLEQVHRSSQKQTELHSIRRLVNGSLWVAEHVTR